MKKVLFTILVCSIIILGTSALGNSQEISSVTDNFISVSFELPKGEMGKVVAYEGRGFKIIIGTDVYRFSPYIKSKLNKEALVEVAFTKQGITTNKLFSINEQFEVIDIGGDLFKFKVDSIYSASTQIATAPGAGGQDECCVTCKQTQTTVCSTCWVELCGERCCTGGACCNPPI